MIQSPEFARRFSQVAETTICNEMLAYCGSQRGGPLGISERLLYDDAGTPHVFRFETFFNQHDALTLGIHIRPHSTGVQLP